jgi:DUF4097 and DUF4098 domain-containing protein YvlB
MKAPAMRVTRSFVVTSFCAFVAATAAAQGVPPPVAAPPPSTGFRAASFERYQEARSGPESSERWSRTFKIGASGSLELSNISGDVIVTGGPGDEIRVDAVKRARARGADDAKSQLDAVTIEVLERGGRVEINTAYPHKKNIHVDVDYTVQVPASAGVSVRSVSGGIKVTGVNGETRLETVSGNVTTSASGQLSRVKSVSGDVSVAEGAARDVLSLGTVSGNLMVRRLKARTLEVQTISGDLSLADTVCERVQAKSLSGDVHFGGPLAQGGRYEFNTHSGDVRLSLAGATGFDLSANSFSGDLRSELPLAGRGDAVPAHSERAPDGPHHQELRGTFGDGSAVVVIKTFSGDLLVTGAGGAAKDKVKGKGKR